MDSCPVPLTGPYAFLYQGAWWRNREIVGTEPSIKTADSARLRGSYDAWYRPENMIVVVEGDADADTVEASHTRAFQPSGAERGPVLP